MKKFLVSAVLAAAAAAAPLAAQGTPGTPLGTTPVGPLKVTPYVGYMIFGDYFENGNNVEYSNKDAALYGAQATLDLSRNVGLYGNFGYSKTDWTFENLCGAGCDVDAGNVGVWLFDGGAQFRVPVGEQVGSWITPIAQVGLGGARYTVDNDNIKSLGQTVFAFNYGLGADYQFTPQLGVRLFAKDYVTSLKWRSSSGFAENLKERNIAHNWALSAGLNFGF